MMMSPAGLELYMRYAVAERERQIEALAMSESAYRQNGRNDAGALPLRRHTSPISHAPIAEGGES